MRVHRDKGVLVGSTIRGSNPGRGEIFRIGQDRAWGPVTLLDDGYRVIFLAEIRPRSD